MCGRVYSRRGMARHIRSCIDRTVKEKESDNDNGKSLIVSVEGERYPQYWLTLEVPFDGELFKLDRFLRKIWLECCGHSSAYKIRGAYYWENDMNIALQEVVSPGERFYHEYDFGSTTVLTLRFLGPATKVFPAEEIAVLARNMMPQYRCSYCDNIAVKICQECTGWLCEECAREHPKDKDMYTLLPVVNSPRTGVCVYTG